MCVLYEMKTHEDCDLYCYSWISLNAGNYLFSRDHEGHTPLSIIVVHMKSNILHEVIEKLVESGADVNHKWVS